MPRPKTVKNPPANYDYTAAARAKAYGKRQDAKGLKRFTVQGYPDDRDAIVAHAAGLRAKREAAALPTLAERLIAARALRDKKKKG